MVSEKKLFKVFSIISLWELYMGMSAILIYGPRPSVHIFNPLLTQGSTWSLNKFGPGISEEKSFKGVNWQTDGRMDDDGGRAGCDLNSSSWAENEPSAQMS